MSRVRPSLAATSRRSPPDLSIPGQRQGFGVPRFEIVDLEAGVGERPLALSERRRRRGPRAQRCRHILQRRVEARGHGPLGLAQIGIARGEGEAVRGAHGRVADDLDRDRQVAHHPADHQRAAENPSRRNRPGRAARREGALPPPSRRRRRNAAAESLSSPSAGPPTTIRVASPAGYISAVSGANRTATPSFRQKCAILGLVAGIDAEILGRRELRRIDEQRHNHPVAAAKAPHRPAKYGRHAARPWSAPCRSTGLPRAMPRPGRAARRPSGSVSIACFVIGATGYRCSAGLRKGRCGPHSPLWSRERTSSAGLASWTRNARRAPISRHFCARQRRSPRRPAVAGWSSRSTRR